MLFNIKSSSKAQARPRVTPDPSQAAALEQKMKSLNYHPENGFHRDRSQDRLSNPRKVSR